METFIAIKNDETRATFLTEKNMALLKDFGEVREISGELSVSNAAAQIKDSEVYMTCWGSPRLERTILDSAPNLKLLVHLCGTVVPFVSQEMFERGIRVISGNAFLPAQLLRVHLLIYLPLSAIFRFTALSLRKNGDGNAIMLRI